MKKIRTNLPVSVLTKEQLKKFNTWVESDRPFINLTLADGRVFSARRT